MLQLKGRFITVPVLSLLLFTLFSCNTVQDDKSAAAQKDTLVNADPQTFTECTKALEDARRMDSILLTHVEADPAASKKAIKAFTDYAYFCQNDSLSPVYLVKSAQVARAMGNFHQAKVVLDVCIKDYPSFRDRPAALFLLAQLYDEDGYLNNEEEARKLYKQIIEEYPESDWAVSAQGAMRFLGRSDEQMLKELQRKK